MKADYLGVDGIPESEWTKLLLARAIRATRMERGGISLKKIAVIIGSGLDWAELEALVGWLTKGVVLMGRVVGK